MFMIKGHGSKKHLDKDLHASALEILRFYLLARLAGLKHGSQMQAGNGLT